MAYLLDEIEYEINGCEIDKTRFVGMTTTLQNYISLDNFQSQNLLNSGWSSEDEIFTGPHFNFSVPLKNVLEFAEDYKKPEDEPTRNEQIFELEITWKIPHVTPSDFAKIKM